VRTGSGDVTPLNDDVRAQFSPTSRVTLHWLNGSALPLYISRSAGRKFVKRGKQTEQTV